jgi:hypothetical protein
MVLNTPQPLNDMQAVLESAAKAYQANNCPELYEGNVQAVRAASGFKTNLGTDLNSVYKHLTEAARLHVAFAECYLEWKAGSKDTTQKLNVTYMVDAWRNLLAKRGIYCQAFVVSSADGFTVTNGVVIHTPSFEVDPDRSNIIAVWAKFTMPKGNELHFFLRKSDLDAREGKTSNKSEYGPWKTNYTAMCCAKVISFGARQLGRTLTGVDMTAIEPYTPEEVDYNTGEVVAVATEEAAF